MRKKNEQEVFWQEEFGNDYCKRARGADRISSNIALFSKVISKTKGISSILELGSNIGLNLIALRHLCPEVKMSAVEINKAASAELKINIPDIELHNMSILDYVPNNKWDLVMTKGVLIHLNPDTLFIAYDIMYHSSANYLLVCEYYNPVPIEVEYRGYTNKLFKRDFAGDLMDRYSDLVLIDYGFAYHRDTMFPQDDITWFLLQKK